MYTSSSLHDKQPSILLCILVVAVLSVTEQGECREIKQSAEQPGGSLDIYDAINILVDSLRLWSVQTNIPSADLTTNLGQDSLGVTEFFPDCHLILTDSSDATTIILPPYMGLLTTILQADNRWWNSSKPPAWNIPLEWDGEHLLVDSIPISLTGQSTPDSLLVDQIRRRIALLRTIGLPEQLQSRHPADDSLQVMVTVRGRDIIDIPFESTWLSTLSRIAEATQVYAGILNAKVDSSQSSVNYYLLLNYPGIKGHHFLEWRDVMVKEGSNWQSKGVTVMFSPFIRTDNLKNLFSQPRPTGRDPIEIRLTK